MVHKRKKTSPKDEIQVKQQENNRNSDECDGPLQMAPNPAKKLVENNKVQEPSLRPQRKWKPEQGVNYQNQNTVTNNWPTLDQGNHMGYNRCPMPYERSPLPFRRNEREQVTMHQNQKCVEKMSSHISSIGEDGKR